MIFFGQRSLDRGIREFVEHDHAERNHQGPANALIEAREVTIEGDVVRDERLGGLFSSYSRLA